MFFWITGLVLFFPIVFFKSFFIKMTILAYSYPIWLLSGYAYGLPASRIVSHIGNKYYDDLYMEGFIYAFLSYIGFLIVIRKLKEKEYQFYKLKIGILGRTLLFLLFIVFVAVAYPKSLGLASYRFGSLGGVVVFLGALTLVTTTNTKWSNIITLLFFILILFIVIRGERVDFILMLVSFIIFKYMQSNVKIFKFFIISLGTLILAVTAGFIRSGVDIDFIFLFQALPRVMMNFGTAVDVIHVYMSSVWYYYNVGVTIEPLINIVFSYIPLFGDRGVSSELNFTRILIPYIKNLGGGLFYSVGMMSAGGIGVVLFGILFGYIFKKLFLLRGIYSLLFITFFILQFRFQWYGVTYYSSPLIFSILFIVLLHFHKAHMRSSL